ncbi:hypothetical protein Q31b_19770 [Novipirellula aureliae]|uniref:Uncharacterized protein n=1 Tax=Novipirellula aureliae TaxID=2527966 RepID=A0A5C6DZT1_9BACT|nr:hypothetical protein [Novipirellula aureliae]TWU42943.1 hypothetical protein Q31b_19770 [Novipirellula aureliae]
MLKCPQCDRSVSIEPSSSASERVKCPHCGKTFLTPGVIGSAPNDDDDWLSLDSDTVPSPNQAPASDPFPKSAPDQAPIPDPPTAGSSSVADFDDWGDEIPALLPAKERKPSSNFGTDGSSSSDDFDAFDFGSLPDFETPSTPSPHQNPAPKPLATTSQTPASTPNSPKTASTADQDEYANEYRLKCKVCGSLLYVQATQAGKTVKCSDCYTQLTVPPPPKIKKKQSLDLQKVETFGLGESPTTPKPIEAFRKSAEQYLDEASRAEIETPPPTYDVPSIGVWLKGIFGIFFDIGVIAHWIILSVFASALAVLYVNFQESKIIIPASYIGGFFLCAIVISCGFAILQSVANGEERVTDWPIFDFYAWMEPLFVAFSAFGFSAVPVWFLCQWLFGPGLMAVAITMLSLYILFPFVLLSMLDMGNPFTPFSAEVSRSITNSHEAWGGLYFTAGIMFFLLLVFYGMCTTIAPQAAAVMTVFVTIGCAFLYFAMIGRLAYTIGQDIIEPKLDKPKPDKPKPDTPKPDTLKPDQKEKRE